VNNKYYIFNNGRLLLCDDEVVDVPKALPGWLACEGVRVFEENDEMVCHMARSTQEALHEGYRWVDLRESFHVLTERTYIKAGKASTPRTTVKKPAPRPRTGAKKEN
jgi:hypothetical protein